MANTQTYANQTTQQTTFYNRTLLERLLPELLFMKYGQKKPVPKKNGATVDFRKFARLETATTPLVEGVTPVGKAMSITNVTATVEGYGDFVEFSDFIDIVGIDPFVTETLEVLGEQAAETLDEVVRDVVAAGTNVYRVNSRATRATMASGDNLDGATMRRARQVMARNNVKPIAGAGAYIGIIHPDVSYDIMSDSAWINANQYAGSTKLFDGEIGKMYGVRYIESTKAPVFAGAGSGSIDVYGSIIIGANGYGIADIGGSSKPETFVKQVGSAGSADPLNQRGSCGWRAYLAAVRLDELCILRVESAASVGAL
jgi:N4-gp56 family major capsid protein